MTSEADGISDELIQEFITIFATDVGHFYRANLSRAGRNGEKVEAKYFPVQGDPDLDDYRSHIEGKRPLSIVLNKQGPDGQKNMVTRAAVDIDDYNLDPATIAGHLRQRGVPVLLTTSKSSGVHVHLLFKEPMSAERARLLARQVGDVIGAAKADYFPKQDLIDWDPVTETGNKGNGLNLCYYGDTRQGWSENGPLTLEQFVARCFEVMLDPDEVAALMDKLPSPKGAARPRPSGVETAASAALNVQAAPFYDGPPCLQKIAAGAATGDRLNQSRNNYLYNVAVFEKMRGGGSDPDQIADAMFLANTTHLAKPLPLREVMTIAKSVAKTKNANYKCREDPICSFCDMGLCKTRKYGAARRGAELWFSVTVEMLASEIPGQIADESATKILLTFEDPNEPIGTVTIPFSKDPPTFTAMRNKLRVRGLPYMLGYDADQWDRELTSALAAAKQVRVPRGHATVGLFLKRLLLHHDACRGNEARSIAIGYIQAQSGRPSMFHIHRGEFRGTLGVGVSHLFSSMQSKYGITEERLREQISSAERMKMCFLRTFFVRPAGAAGPQRRFEVVLFWPDKISDWLDEGPPEVAEGEDAVTDKDPFSIHVVASNE